MGCPFCDNQVIAKQKLFETDYEYVLYNIRKSTRGRCIVVPKRHTVSIRNLTKKETTSLLNTVRLVSLKLEKYLRPDGFNYGFNEGVMAGQTIEHLHFHILPRFNGDGLPEFHLFHGDPKTKSNLSEQEYLKLVKEFRKLF